MSEYEGSQAVAIVGIGAVMPDAPDAATFWSNISGGRYSITDVPPERWDPALYYDADPHAPEKTYSKIGGWVRDAEWNPMAWRLPIPPLVGAAMDEGQKWAVACTRAALLDAGWPERKLNQERTAVILGNAMAGEKHYLTAMRINFPEFGRVLEDAPSFAALPAELRAAVLEEAHQGMLKATPAITEDTMPGELGNVMAGRVANVFDFRGPNFITDAACASALAAISAGVDGLVSHKFDSAIAGGVDRNMGATSFVKFCKIGALSATGTRPYADGADGFVMGEGAAVFLMKRLEDAERDGDRIYAVLVGIAGSSDGKGKGITAPNPVGQRLAVERAWQQAGLDPATAGMVEGHGTSTRVGDRAEVEALTSVFGPAGAAPGSIALGSVKSNIGHLKAAAGAAGMFKAAMSLHHKVLAPSLNFAAPNPGIDFAGGPFKVNTELRDWEAPAGSVRTAGVSAFGFGGTNFHVVLEEHVPGRFSYGTSRSFAVSAPVAATSQSVPVVTAPVATAPAKAPVRGLAVVGAADDAALAARLEQVVAAAGRGEAPAPTAPAGADLAAAVRVAVDFADAADLADKCTKALGALRAGQPAVWRALRPRGIFLGRGGAPSTAFLFTGQGSQYVNMLKELRDSEPIVAETFAEADRVMSPLLGRPLTDYIFIDGSDPEAVKTLERQLLQTEITQPAVLATDIALYRLLAAYGVEPDMVMGHSLGEYAALVAAGALSFASALEAVSARGHGMATLELEDSGAMAAVFAPLTDIERIVAEADGYVVVANVNSSSQAVIGGATAAVEAVVATCVEAGYTAMRIPVSHAFHTSIVAPASVPLIAMLERLDLHAPVRPIVANVDGEFYPTGPQADGQMLDILGRQVYSPVQFVRGLGTLYDAGARLFLEVGPKKALHGFADDVLGATHPDAQALFTNHPKLGDLVSFNQALAGLYAAGLGTPAAVAPPVAPAVPAAPAVTAAVPASVTPSARPVTAAASPAATAPGATMTGDRYLELGHLFADFLEHGREIMGSTAPAASSPPGTPTAPVVITGAALGLPGTEHVFDDSNVRRLLDGEQLIDLIPTRFRHRMLDKNITRLVKSESGGGSFESIDDPADVVKLAGRAGKLDLVAEFGVDADRDRALDTATRLAIGAGFDALRDAGIPLVQHYKLTSLGTHLPSRWGLPDAMRDDTGVIFASAFPGMDSLTDEVTRHNTDLGRRHELETLRDLRSRVTDGEPVATQLDHRIDELETLLKEEGYQFDRRFLFRALSMGHSQFAEIIGARGPNTQVNSACASTTQAISLAEDWIKAGRCSRVVVVAGDNVTSDNLVDWVGSGFLASGAAATDDSVENAALPFDNRRHGMIMGMGAAALVIESADAAAERGIRPICEVLASVTANSAFHGTRLDVDHISSVMERLVTQAETRGVQRHAVAGELVFVSHETYTPARGGSASAEINALRQVFGADADRIVIANTKGMTGHPMGVGIEDVLAVKALETGLVPPIPNFRDVDPELGQLNLSKGGTYPIRYAIRLAAGFGSQISMTMLRWTPVADGEHREPSALGFGYRIADREVWTAWLRRMSGTDDPQLEVVTRRLRVVDPGAPARIPVPAVPVAVPVVAAVTAPVVPVPVPVAAAVAAPVPPVAAVPAEPVAPLVDPVVAEVLAVVSAKTGYPVEMLDLDLDLEADLGVDTVKQAEVFAAVRETFAIERDDQLQLRDYPTLTHVIGFVRDRATNLPAAPVAVAVAPVAAAAPAPAAVVAPAVPAAPVAGADPVVAEVLAVVSAKTGYPVEMLDLDLDLEADLGVDTVKQAEVFAAVRETFAIERDDQLQLRDYPTLTHVIGFVRDRATNLPAAPVAVAVAPVAAAAPAPAAVVAPAVPAAPVAGADPVVAEVLAVVSAKTGYPVEMLDLDLDLEADLGVDTVKQAEVFAAVRETFAIERDDQLQLRDYPTLTHVIGFVRDRATNLPAAPVAVAVAPVAAAAPAPAAVVAPAVPAAPVAGADPVVAEVLAVVSAKTGYPVEMLDLDLDLEADLGVDTVKQAEVFAAVRETFAIERDDQLQLRDYPTLTHVIGFVRDRATNLPAAPVAVAVAPVAAAAPAPAAVVAPAVPAAPVAGADPVVAEVLAVVSAKTGYPVEMLDLDLDLEADLGVDTVKQAEVFAAVRETFAIERDDQLQLRDYPTLTHVIGFVRDRATNLPDSAGSAGSAVPEAPAAPVTAEAAAPLAVVPVLSGSLEAADAILRRVPVPVLRPALGRCAVTGVTLDESSRIVVVADQAGVADALELKLTGLGAAVLRVDPATDSEALAASLADFVAAGAVTGVYWLPALDAEGPVDGLDLDAWHEALRVRVTQLHATMRAVVEGSPFLVTATTLGGRHGYEPSGAVNPLGGGVTGFAKAYGREATDTLVKAVDLSTGLAPAIVAGLLVDETLRDPGCVEVGYPDAKPGDRWTIGLQVQPAADGQPGLVLDSSTVYVVTGAAGSIVSAIVADLAGAGGGGVFHLLDLADEPDPTDADLVRYALDRDGLKADLIARHKADGDKVTPVMVERELAVLERRSAALAGIEAVAAAGGKAFYHSVDLTDVAAVGAIVDEALAHSGRVDVLVHAAGIEISRRIADKEPAEFGRVLGVKADGWFALMSALRGRDLGAVVAFSSVAGRFGNLGQTDYSAANDLLCKLTSNLRSSRPGTRGIAIDWTAWGGIGMATRGSIPVMMAAAGIDVLPPEAGIATVRRELTAGGTRDEIVVAGRLGMMTDEYAPAGGLDVESFDVHTAGPMVGQVVGMGVHTGLVVETTLDPVQQPFLDHHRIGGTPVLPGVMGMEAFAELARLPFPERHVSSVEDVDFLRPLKFYRDEPRTLLLSATYTADGDDLVASCRLEAARMLPGRDEPEVTTHFTGRVRLTRTAPRKAGSTAPGTPSGEVAGADAVYAVYFHGPAYKVLDQVWRHGSATMGRLAQQLPAGHRPEDGGLVAVPRLVELCFQTAGVGELADRGLLALPAHVDRVSLVDHPAGSRGRLAARVVEGAAGGIDAEVVDGKGRVWVRLEGYRTSDVPESFDEAVLAPLRALSRD